MYINLYMPIDELFIGKKIQPHFMVDGMISIPSFVTQWAKVCILNQIRLK